MIAATCDFDGLDRVTWHALIVGAGPAGSLAARQLARAGVRVLLVERKGFPRGKVCGACLNGRALAVLDAVGLDSLVSGLGGIGLDELRLYQGGRTLPLALPAGAAVSRPRFDAALVEAACNAGAQFLPETQALVAGLDGCGRRVILSQRDRRATVTARLVLVAAGLGNRWAQDRELPRTEVARWARLGAGCVVNEFPESYRERTIFMAVGRRGYVGLVRVEDGSLNLAAAFDRDFVRSTGGLRCAAAAVLAEAGLPPLPALDASSWQGTASLTRRTRPLAAERVFLLGDAAGYVEPFTGEGMGAALSAAHTVTPVALRAIACWAPTLERSWADLYERLIGRRQLLCHGLATVLRHPLLERLAFELASTAPGVARKLIERVNAPSLLPPESYPWAS